MKYRAKYEIITPMEEVVVAEDFDKVRHIILRDRGVGKDIKILEIREDEQD